MFRNYVTPTEFYQFHAVKDLIDDIRLVTALNSAGIQVRQDLIGRGDSPRAYQVPVMMVANQENYQKATYSSNTTGSAIEAFNSSRLVVESGTTPTGTVTVELDGSNNGSDDSPVWIPVRDMEDKPLKIDVTSDLNIVSSLFLTLYPYYRFRVTTSESVSLSIYLVDSSVDELIRWKAMELGLLDIIDPDSRVMVMHDESKEKYRYVLDNLRPDYDSDGDYALEDGDEATRNRAVGYR